MPRKKNSLGPLKPIVRAIVDQVPVIGPPIARVMLEGKTVRKPRSRQRGVNDTSVAMQAMMARSPYGGTNFSSSKPKKIGDPKQVAVRNCDAYMRQLRDPFGVRGQRLPTDDTLPTLTFTTVDRGSGVAFTDASPVGGNSAVGITIARPYPISSKLSLASIAAGVETYTQSDESDYASIFNVFAAVRCISMGVRVWTGTPSDAAQNSVFVFPFVDYDYGDTLSNMQIMVDAGEDPSTYWCSALKTQVNPVEASWDPAALSPQTLFHTATGTTISTSGPNAFEWWQIPAHSTTTIWGNDRAIAFGVAGTNTTNSSYRYEIIRHYEGAVFRETAFLFDPQGCFGSEAELDYAYIRSQSIPSIRDAGTVRGSMPKQMLTSASSFASSSMVGASISTKKRMLLRALHLDSKTNVHQACNAVCALYDVPYVDWSRYDLCEDDVDGKNRSEVTRAGERVSKR